MQNIQSQRHLKRLLMRSRYLLLIVFSVSVFASTKLYYDKEITGIFNKLSNISSIDERIRIVSGLFLNRPYHLGPLGEGNMGKYDTSPLYRTDSFDCQTYVSTVLALSQSSNLSEFKRRINQIRYAENKPLYLKRNHFVSSDWNINNQRKGFIKDITKSIYDRQGQAVYKMAVATIDKSSWFAHTPKKNIKIKNNTGLALVALKRESQHLPSIKARIPYIPLTSLFYANGQSNDYLFAQIPSGAIIEIIRPNWNLKRAIGTNLNVSHLGFAIRKNKTLYFREASSVYKKVIDVPLKHYLKQYLTNKTIKGINVQRVNGIKRL